MTEEEKKAHWDIMAATRRPPGMTNRRLEKVRLLVWDDSDFWFNTVGRGRPDNFWCILFEVALDHGIIKP